MKDLFEKSALIFGCGNILFGDDGFGPAVIHQLTQQHALPEDVLALDMGTSIRDTLLDLTLSEKKPGLLLIVDAVDFPDRSPGEIFEIPVTQIPEKKASDFSLHQFPTINLLAKLKDQAKIKIIVLVAQVDHIPDEVSPGLSKTVQEAVKPACERIVQILETALQ
ncbi:MAG: hydrogenase maturation protease [Desulfobacteraceae bacterium]|nr:MAG: hydrogenase maturation protease [Desulfobacteraceae bacterium]